MIEIVNGTLIVTMETVFSIGKIGAITLVYI